MSRYQRQIMLKELGLPGQQKLLAAKVLVIGAGGLGCPVLQYLAAAGVGTLGIVDDDVVSLSNLHRQVLYGMADLGKPKAAQAALHLAALNPEISILVHPERLSTHNAWDLMAQYDIVVDTSDNFPTRYLVNDACVLLGKPLVYGAVSRFEGQVAVFNFPTEEIKYAANYRDLFPHPPQEGEVANCAEAGVLGVLPGIIGSLQAAQAIKLITGIGQPLAGRVQTFNLLTDQWFDWQLMASPETAALVPADRDQFESTNYEWACGLQGFSEIDARAFSRLVSDKKALVVDVREISELPLVQDFDHQQVPLSQLVQRVPEIKQDSIIVFCQSGKRSRQAAQILAAAFPAKKVFSLKDGILGWKADLHK